MNIDIDKLTETELVDLNRRIVERLRLIHQMKAHKRMMDFSIGERVKFCSQTGETIRGVITRYNRKTVTILADNQHRWNVSPAFIERDALDAEVVQNDNYGVALFQARRQ